MSTLTIEDENISKQAFYRDMQNLGNILTRAGSILVHKFAPRQLFDSLNKSRFCTLVPPYRLFQCLKPSPTTSATSAMMMKAFGSMETVKSFSSIAWRLLSTAMIMGRSAPE